MEPEFFKVNNIVAAYSKLKSIWFSHILEKIQVFLVHEERSREGLIFISTSAQTSAKTPVLVFHYIYPLKDPGQISFIITYQDTLRLCEREHICSKKVCHKVHIISEWM